MTIASRRLLEICVDDPAGVAAAITGGADRIELCAALALGGLTPSPALVAQSLAHARASDLAVHAMVRPRAGDFAYTRAELDLAIAEARALLALGVDGLVFGAARHGQLDRPVLEEWLGAVCSGDACPALTLHRAIDAVDDPVAAVTLAADLGFDRVLTSGGAPTAPAGIATIASMAAAAGERLVVMAGSGVGPADVADLFAAGVREFHASASAPLASADPRVTALGFATPPRRVTDAARVRALRTALDTAEGNMR